MGAVGQDEYTVNPLHVTVYCPEDISENHGLREYIKEKLAAALVDAILESKTLEITIDKDLAMRRYNVSATLYTLEKK